MNKRYLIFRTLRSENIMKRMNTLWGEGNGFLDLKQVFLTAISRNIKTLLHKTLIRPVLTYGAETWVLSKQDEHCFSIFEV